MLVTGNRRKERGGKSFICWLLKLPPKGTLDNSAHPPLTKASHMASLNVKGEGKYNPYSVWEVGGETIGNRP